ncbi:MAG: 1-acyl-sn-glycerol-3-phosphate acyltransferase, partial [Chlamydiia bacterium]|nr:1-acyl-sn-glycerol-3-phosphate acyltransferase [Chlamydiia bacterium]
MRKWLLSVGSYLVLGALSLRYRLEVRGLETIGKDKGVLFLPNHPAEIEPILIYNLLARRFRPRPLVIEHFYYLKGARFFMNLIRALPIPNFDLSTNSWKVRQVEKALGKVEEKIKEGENFLIYPSGHLKREGHENIGGNSFIHSILGQCHAMTVVLVRSDGLWGSSFSCAMSEESPDFWKGAARGIKKAFLSGLFFLPRRKVMITFEKNPEGFPRQGSRLELNQFLERWYNQYQDGGNVVTSEPLHLVSYSCFKKDLLQIKEREKRQESQTKIAIPEDVRSE